MSSDGRNENSVNNTDQEEAILTDYLSSLLEEPSDKTDSDSHQNDSEALENLSPADAAQVSEDSGAVAVCDQPAPLPNEEHPTAGGGVSTTTLDFVPVHSQHAPSVIRSEAIVELEHQKKQQLQKMLSQYAIPIPAVQNVPIDQITKSADQSTKSTIELKSEIKQEHVVEQSEILETKQNLLEWCENGRPVWAQNRFEALLFEVSGLTLAVPLVALGFIAVLDDKLTKIAKQSDWFMGILNSSHGDVRVVNTALFVMPERYDPQFLKTAKYVISIEGMSWALSVDSVNQPITLAPEDVKWRTDRTKRAWLAGTIKEKMCTLIDIPQFARILNQLDSNLSS